MSEVFVYHVRHKGGKRKGYPFATVALQERNGDWCRAVAVCNPKDNFRKNDGSCFAMSLLWNTPKDFGPMPNSRNPKAVKSYLYHKLFKKGGVLEGQPAAHVAWCVSLTDYELETVLHKSASQEYKKKHAKKAPVKAKSVKAKEKATRLLALSKA